MIQRVQSIFLLTATTALTALFRLLPNTRALATQSWNLPENPGVLGLLMLSIALSITALLVFKNRPRQAMLTGLCLITSTLLLILLIFQWMQQDYTNDYLLALLCPTSANAALLLARKFILQDENLVKSSERLR